MSHLATILKRRKRRLPPCGKAAQRAVELFLSHFEPSIAGTLDDMQELAKTDQSPALLGQIGYLTHQVSTLKWLRSMNATRRVYE